MSDAALLARTTGDWRSVEEVLEHLRRRPAASFLLPHESASETAAMLDQHFPGHSSALFAAADACCRNEISLLGAHYRFPQGIDWHQDPVTGFRWPLVHRTRLSPYLGRDRSVDLQVFWKLNRHQHFLTLGIAYWLTGNERYVDTFSTQIESWIEANPVQHGVNWYYGIEISLRIIAWTVAFQLFRSSPKFREKTGTQFLKSLWQQADFLSRHLQTAEAPGVVPNNHIMSEVTALALVGSAFPEFRRAEAWRDAGLELLSREAIAQTHPDGVNKEQATGYHRFIVELLLLIVARCRQSALPHAPVLEQTLERMLDYVLFTTSPVGTAPMWGDSDYGRALGLGGEKDFWDFRSLLAAGAALFGRSDWKFVAGRFDEAAFWVLGAIGLNRWRHLEARSPQQTSRGFPDGGIYVVRDSWAPAADIAFFRCGSFGLGGENHCAHAHCDLLSFVLWVRGEPLLVDSGTYMYRSPLRDYFRLTSAHNTVRIDGRDQATPIGDFRWKQVPEAKCITWSGELVTGTLTSPNGTAFTRKLHHPRPGVWDVIDTFNGHGETTLEWFFHFAPGLELEPDTADRRVVVLRAGKSFVVVHTPDGGVQPEVRDSWYSYQYGVKQRTRQLYARWQGNLHGAGMSFRWQFQLMNNGPDDKGDV